MMINLPLTPEQATYLEDILDIWIEGYDEAEDHTISDRMIESAEELITVVQGLKNQRKTAEDIKRQLQEAK